MGMDVIGARPTSKVGQYFGNNGCWWHPLATYIIAFGPENVVSKCTHWQSNDGDGLEADDALHLAFALQDLIESGHTERYAAWYASQVTTEPCPISRYGLQTPEPCWICDGTGRALTGDSGAFDVRNVQNLVDFLRESVGFVIA